MSQSETYQSVYQRLLASSELQPLSKFKSYKSFNLTYPDAIKYPDFFNNNLLAQGRVIKVVRGKSALIRAFCYQLMKLTFQIEVVDVDYVEIFKGIIFLPALLLEDTDMQSPSSGRAYTDRQYKRLLADFVELMGQQSIPNFQLTVMEYPIVQEALTRTTEALIARCYQGNPPYDTEELLDWLSRTFQIGIQRHGKCYRFEQSDVFVYEENEEEFYISYLNEMAEVSDYSESTYRFDGRHSREEEKSLAKKQHNNSSPSPSLHRNSMELDQYKLPIYPSDKYRYSAQIYARRTEDTTPPNNYRRTIDNLQFIKDLGRQVDESVHNDKPSDKHSKIGSLLDIMSDRSSKDLSQPYKASEESSSLPLSEQQRRPSQQILRSSHDSQQLTPQFTTNLYLRQQDDHYNPFTKKYSEQYMGQLYQKNHQFDFITQRQPELYQPSSTSPFQHYSQANNYKFDSYSNNNNDIFSSNYSFQPIKKDQFSNQNQQKNVLIDSLEDFKPKFTQQQDQNIFYKPKSNKQFNKSQNSTGTHRQQKQEDSRGTLYRQFTDTRVLQAMPEIQRMKINIIRRKYKGMHKKDLKNMH